jgi:predicted flap endonuclease-1-like 5' DNA nuclease
MGFLLAKILLLMVVAAACGGAFSYWWFRRHYEDVSLEFARSREEWSAWRRSFEERLAARPALDLEPIWQQLAAVDQSVRAIDIPPGLPTDLSPVLEAISANRQPAPEPLDLAPLQARLDEILRKLAERRAADAPPPDLGPIDKRLTAIEHALFPVETRLDELASALRAVRAPVAPDLGPVLERLGALQARLDNPPALRASVREGSRNLLSHPSHGKPDDLTQLKGVAKVLERTLHKMGVFYFWQIAEWSPEDVQYVDSQLDDFRGHIERDGWVTQASELAAQPSAAHPPEQH